VIDSGLLVVKQSATGEPTPSSPNSGSTLVHIRRLVERREIGARGKEYPEMPVARTREIVAVRKEKPIQAAEVCGAYRSKGPELF
jgi:hypothetical protein